MTDGEIVATLVGLATAAGGSMMTLGRWLGGTWRDIRREEIAAAKENATAQRAAEGRMVDALLKQAESNGALAVAHAQLGGKIDTLSAQIADVSERTPVETDFDQPITRPGGRANGSLRSRTNPHGYRSPRPGERDD